jgi:microcystin-dependent protein
MLPENNPQVTNPIIGLEPAAGSVSNGAASHSINSVPPYTSRFPILEEPKPTPLEGYSAPTMEDIGSTPMPTDRFSFGLKGPLIFTIVMMVGGLLAFGAYGYLHKRDLTKLASQSTATSPNNLNLSPAITTLSFNRDTIISQGKRLTATGEVLIQNEVDSASALKIQNATGENILIVDTQGKRVGIGTAPTGTAALQVAGDISVRGAIVATGTGGSGGFSLDSSGLRIGSVLICSANGCISSATPPSVNSAPSLDVNNVGYLNAAQTFTGANSFTNPANSFNGTFSGNGGALTGVNANTLNNQSGSYYTNASNLSSGTLSDSRLSTNVTLAGNTFNGASQLVQLDSSGILPALNGSAVTNVNAISLQGNNSAYFTNATNISSGTLNDARLSVNVTLAGNTFNGASQLVKNNASGDLPALSAINLTNVNASAISTGTVNDLRLSNNVTLQGNTFNGASQLLQLTAAAFYPSLNGSLITNIAAGNIASGTLGDNRLSVNVALLGAATQTFTGNNIFSNVITAPGLETINNTHTIAVGFSGTSTGNITYNFDNTATPGTYIICTTVGNCAGAGGGVTTPGGSLNKLAKFTAAQTLGDSILTDNGTTVSVGGTLNATNLQRNSNTVCDVSGNCAGVGGQVGGSGTSGTIPLFNGASSITDSILTQSGGAITVAGNINTTGQYQVGGTQISSANLSNDSNLAKLNGTGPQIFTGNNKFTSTFLSQNASNSTTAFQIQNAAGTSNLFIADTTNNRIGIGITPGYTLDVAGDINISSGSAYRINGVAICGPSATCAPSSGSNSYLQNSVSQQNNANLNIRSVNSGSVVGIVRGAAGQTADLFRAQDENGANVFKVGSTGNTTIQPSANSSAGFQIQNAAGTSNLLIADTVNTRIAIAQASANYALDVAGDINSTTGVRVGGTLLCSAGGCLAASGSGSYIQNGTTQQSGANFNIKNTNVNSVGGVIEAASGQVADILDVQSHTGTTKYLSVSSGGNVGVGVSGTPGQKLEVNGSIRISSGSFYSYGGSDSIRLQDAGSDTLGIYTNNTLQVSLDAGGNFALSGNGLLVMGVKTSDPACTAGSVYYNSTNAAFRGCQSAPATWVDLISPVGTIMQYAGSSAPTGYFVADGSAVSRTTYSRLFAVIGTTYGVGDGSTTFNLPDMRGRVAVGLGTNADDNTLGANDGSVLANRTPKHNSTNSLTLPNHTHSDNINFVDTGHVHGPSSGSFRLMDAGGVYYDGGGGTDGRSSTTAVGFANLSKSGSVGNPTSNPAINGSIGPGGSRPTDTPAYVTLNYIIKY